MEESKNHKKKEHDPLLSIKFKGYCWSRSAPGEDTTLAGLVSFAKFFLCKHSQRLWKDPIWDEYTDEEILIEYFAHLFAKDEAARNEFEVQINAGSDMYEAEYDWLDRMVKQNQNENRKKLEEMPDKVSFTPGGEDKEE